MMRRRSRWPGASFRGARMPGFCVTCRRAGGLDWHREVKACYPGRTGLPGRLLRVKTAEARCTRPRLGDGRLQVGSRSTGRCCLGRMLLCLPELGHGGREVDELGDERDGHQRGIAGQISGQGDHPCGLAQLVTVTASQGQPTVLGAGPRGRRSRPRSAGAGCAAPGLRYAACRPLPMPHPRRRRDQSRCSDGCVLLRPWLARRVLV
jgi:hypothetical protein